MKKILFLLFLSFLVSCKQGSQMSQSKYTIALDSISESFPEVSHLSYVPLETTETSLISWIDKIVYNDHRIYVFDKAEMKIFCFNEQGGFLKIIHHVGQGPGEYLSPSDMDVDEAGNVYVFDFSGKRVIKYNAGNEKDFEILNVGERALDFAIREHTVFLSRMVKKGSFSVNLASWDKQTGDLNVLRKNELSKEEEPTYCSLHYFFRSGREICYYERFHSLVYQLVGDTIEEYFSFHSKRNPTLEDAKALKRKSVEEQINSDLIKDVSACYSTEKSIFVTFQAIPPIYSLIQKETGKAYCINSLRKAGILGLGAFATTGKYFISYCSPTKENVAYILSVVPDISKSEKERLLTVREDSNPILIFFSFV